MTRAYLRAAPLFIQLLYSVQLIYARNYKEIALLIVASIWYIVCTSVLYIGQHYLERYYGRGSSRQSNERRGLRLLGAFASARGGR